jgi:hypothetical protein
LFLICSILALVNPTDASPDAPDLEPQLERCRRVLEEMSEVGMTLLRSLDPNDACASMRDLSLAYCRISRTIRLTLILDLRLEALARGGLAALVAERALAAATPEAEDDAPEAVEPAEAPERDATARQRLDREAPDEALRYLKRPLTDLVGAICAGFDLSPEATEAAKAPFLALVANDDGPDGAPPRSARRSLGEGGPASSTAQAAGETPARRGSALGP